MASTSSARRSTSASPTESAGAGDLENEDVAALGRDPRVLIAFPVETFECTLERPVLARQHATDTVTSATQQPWLVLDHDVLDFGVRLDGTHGHVLAVDRVLEPAVQHLRHDRGALR